MWKILTSVFTFLLMTGCTAVKPIGLDWKGVPENIKGGQITVVVIEEAPLQVFTPGHAVGAGFIDDITRPDGSSIKLPSSSYLTAVYLREKLISKRGLNLTEVPNELTKKRSAKDPYSPGRPVLEVYVDTNFLGYRPMAWQTYQYMLHGHARLLSATGVILWQNRCKIGGATEDKSLQLDRSDFKNNDALKLKEIIRLAAARCASELTSAVSAGRI